MQLVESVPERWQLGDVVHRNNDVFDVTIRVWVTAFAGKAVEWEWNA